MFRLYQKCEQFRIRPADDIGISRNKWLAWQFDNAVFTFGRTVMNRYEERDDKYRRVRTLEEALGFPPPDPLDEAREKLRRARQRGRAIREQMGLVQPVRKLA